MATLTAEAAFLADILADPSDDAPRLIFADWLEDGGRPERAELIRLQIARERDPVIYHGFLCLPESPCKGCRRERHLERVLADAMDAEIAATMSHPAFRRGDVYPMLHLVRGFVGQVEATCVAFLDGAGTLFGSCPVEEVWLADKRPAGDGAARHWVNADFREPASNRVACEAGEALQPGHVVCLGEDGRVRRMDSDRPGVPFGFALAAASPGAVVTVLTHGEVTIPVVPGAVVLAEGGPARLPARLFGLLDGGRVGRHDGLREYAESAPGTGDAEAVATAALSRAAVRLGREAAGLPAITLLS